MQSRIAELMNSLDNFNIYLPQTQVIINNLVIELVSVDSQLISTTKMLKNQNILKQKQQR